MVRIMSPDNRWQAGKIITADGNYIDYFFTAERAF